MAKIVDTKEYLDMVCQLLAEGQTAVAVPVAGNSMVPFLHHGDTVYVSAPDAPLKKGDIVLYTRKNGQYILHRIIAVHPDGSFAMMGDAQQEKERVDSAARIHARVVRALHRGKLLTEKSFRWWFFRRIWPRMIPLRHRIMNLLGKVKKISR